MTDKQRATENLRALTLDQCIAENIPFSAGYRDFEGYKGNYPDPNWPGTAKICVNVVLNYEEGGEYNPINGDTRTETAIQEMMGAPPRTGTRDIPSESQYEYGTRAGVWRIGRFFEQKGIKMTVYAVGQSILKSPDAARYLVRCGHEFASHGYRWIDYHDLPLAVEKLHIEKCIEAIKDISGEAPRGWYIGRMSVNSRALICQVHREQGLEDPYFCDSYNDELPYWIEHPLEEGKGVLVIPYTLDVNDVKFTTSPGFANPKDWLEYAKLAFDVLYEEGCNGSPKMMTIGLHNRLIGKPARFWALRTLIEYMEGHEGVWFATREEIARHWRKEHPFDEGKLNKIGHFL